MLDQIKGKDIFSFLQKTLLEDASKTDAEDELIETKKKLTNMKQLYDTVNETYNKLLLEKSGYKNDIL